MWILSAAPEPLVQSYDAVGTAPRVAFLWRGATTVPAVILGLDTGKANVRV